MEKSSTCLMRSGEEAVDGGSDADIELLILNILKIIYNKLIRGIPIICGVDLELIVRYGGPS